MEALKIAEGVVIVAFTGLLAITILVWIWLGKISLAKLISEPNGDASLSRLQFLIFTVVIALSLFMISAGTDPLGFPAIPAEVLTLLGISGSSYLVSKGIQFSNPAANASPTLLISPASTEQLPSDGLLLTASLMNVPADTPMPSLTWAIDAPALGSITPKPPNQAQYKGPSDAVAAGMTVTIWVSAPGFQDGKATVKIS